jgi:hypothetical protein
LVSVITFLSLLFVFEVGIETLLWDAWLLLHGLSCNCLAAQSSVSIPTSNTNSKERNVMTDTNNRRTEDHRLTEIEIKLDKLTADVEDLVAAWKAAAWLVSVVKWLGGLAIAGTAIITFMKGR